MLFLLQRGAAHLSAGERLQVSVPGWGCALMIADGTETAAGGCAAQAEPRAGVHYVFI